MSPEELARCAATLEELATSSEVFLDKKSSHFAELAKVRCQANRLIENLKSAVRTRRGQLAPGKNDQRPRPPKPQMSDSPLSFPRRCYSCDQVVEDRHARYRWMCQNCGKWNWQKREHQADLTGRVALVTGARVGIGFQTSLKLLRAGARVHVVTRFPLDAADRYQQESDWNTWREHVTIHGLDLRDLPSLQRFIARLAHDPLDILVNNAAQTVRPTSEFLAHMQRREGLLRQHVSPIMLGRLEATIASSPLLVPDESRRPLDDAEPAEHMVRGFLDRRPTNSWMSRIEEIAPVEALEVHVINSLAPFLLIQGLLPALRCSHWPRRFIVNVAAREGQFAGKTTTRHPHTNMAKAALNMLTRSLAAELRTQDIYINSVDPGWVSDQRPRLMAQRSRREHGDWLPLDDVDAAARVLDPVFLGVSSVEPPPSGILWRNYQPADW
jgi:NAD(P)-dependent dehydrogenase (short-subunit alcohol dehydrogenase family)/predicted RNA-binding Zn-ribbon protein involved in translation (DUF1610 family)